MGASERRFFSNWRESGSWPALTEFSNTKNPNGVLIPRFGNIDPFDQGDIPVNVKKLIFLLFIIAVAIVEEARFRCKETLIFAFFQGLVERFRFGDGFGRTHDFNVDWNEAYDRGANVVDKVLGHDA